MATTAKEAAKFVFQGTVTRLKAATVKAVTDTDKTAVVHVDEIRRAPEALKGFLDHDITVQLSPGERVKAGQQAVFYTDGWMFGESLAVQSRGHDPVKATRGRAAAHADPAQADPAHAFKEHHIQERATEADLVVSGRVVAVGPAGDAPPASATRGLDAALAHRPISEHDPFWTEAVVEVSQVHKGPAHKHVVVRFPASTDVRWHRAPKFQVGQQGVFLLHADAASGTRALGVVSAAHDPQAVYTCLHHADFQPADHEKEAEAAILAAKTH
jgi:hypothetical protein